MRHHSKNRKFGRESAQRRDFVRGLIRGLVLHGRIETTEARAKELRPIIERLVTRARSATTATVRDISAKLGNATDVTEKLVKTIAPKFKERAGGYTRIIKIAPRSARGDNAKLAVIEFVD